MSYFYHHLRSSDHSQMRLLDAVKAGSGGSHWGVFSGLFGPASNELLVVTHAEPLAAGASDFVLRRECWQATARPVDASPCRQPGIYVFRAFRIRTEDVREFVQLSAEAWQTFENAEAFSTRPVGLFQVEPEATPGESGPAQTRMQLITGYDSFASWEQSREPPAEAARKFRRRAQLTLSTVATATRLVNL